MRRLFGSNGNKALLGLLIGILLTQAAWASSPPVAISDQASVPASTAISIDVLANDSDPDGDAIRLISGNPVIHAPSHGATTRLSDSTIRYTPNAGYRGADAFYYRITDGALNATAAVILQVDNEAPVAVDDFADVAVNGSVVIQVTANDSDPDGDPVVRFVGTLPLMPSHGTATWISDTAIRYTPNPGYAGSDSFRYLVTDGFDTIAGADLYINHVNHPPRAVADTDIRTDIDTAIPLNLLANDSDPNDDPIRLTPGNPIISGPSHGTVTVTGERTVEYAPNAGFVGTDTFTYQITDGELTDSAPVTLTVQQFLPPVAHDDTASTREGQVVSINVVANDTDPDGPFIRLIFGDPVIVAPAHGATTRLSNSTIRYTPDTSFSGTDTFRYQITDGDLTDSAWVTVTVVANQPPVARDDAASARIDASVDINVLANDSDPEGDLTRLVFGDPVIAAPANGTTQRLSNTTIRYVPNPGFDGTDVFRYRITDGIDTHSARVTVTLRENLPPVASADRRPTALNRPVTINVVANDTDADGDPLRLIAGDPVIVAPSHGTTTRVSNTTIRYQPNAGFRGTDVFRYRITDGFPGGTHSALVTVRVDNQAPVAVDDPVEIEADSEIVIDVVANDTDADGDTIVLSPFTILEPPDHGTRTLISDTSIRYVPNPGFVGSDSFRYAITDGWGSLAYATVQMTVVSGNSPPVAVNDSMTTTAGTAVTRNVVANDSDPDGDAITLIGIVTQPSSGTATRVDGRRVRYRPNAGFTGTDQLTYRIEDAHGAMATATVRVMVNAIPEPVVTEVERSPVRKGQVKTLVIHGTSFQNAQVYVATLPAEDGAPSRIYPTARLVTLNADGRRMSVEIDATAAGIDGFYNLAIETPGGAVGAPFRVVGPEPVIDMWTPSEPVQGRVHVLQVAGENLSGAQVVPMHPGVMLLDLDNGNSKALSGLLFVSEGVPLGDIDLRIEGLGGTVMLPLVVRPDAASTTLPTQKIDTSGMAPGQPRPEIYYQDPFSPHFPSAGLAGQHLHEDGPMPKSIDGTERAQAKGGGFCFSLGAQVRISFNAILFSLSTSSGDPLTQAAVNALLPGQRLDLNSLTLAISAFIEFEFSYRYCSNGLSDVRFCIRGGIAIMVPAVGGFARDFVLCFGASTQRDLPAEGQVNSHTYTTSNDCAELADNHPASISGQRTAGLRLDCCQNAVMSLRSTGVVFDRGFDIEGPVLEVQPDCAPSETFDLTLEALSFDGDHDIRKDTVGSAETITDPVWLDTNGDQNPEKSDAIAYTRNRVMVVRAKLKASPIPSQPTNVTVRATGPDGIELEGSGVISGAESEIEVRSVQPLPNMTKSYQPIDFMWGFEAEGESKDIGRSRHPLYITLEEPWADRKLFQTALDLGIGAGGATDPASAATKTWASFAGPANIRTWEGRRLFYYQPGQGFAACAHTALALLTSATASGQCGSFAHLLRDAFGVNGIETLSAVVTANTGERFLVNLWQYLTPTFPAPHRWRIAMVHEASGAVGMVPPRTDDTYGAMKSLEGIAGQNVVTPSEKYFSTHIMVALPPDLLPISFYDPSYGRSFISPIDFQTRAIAGFAKTFSGDPFLEFRVRRPSTNLEITFDLRP